jgi:hypothetical protein
MPQPFSTTACARLQVLPYLVEPGTKRSASQRKLLMMQAACHMQVHSAAQTSGGSGIPWGWWPMLHTPTCQHAGALQALPLPGLCKVLGWKERQHSLAGKSNSTASVRAAAAALHTQGEWDEVLNDGAC